ncbi:MAG: GNAT family N-acetyltransferase [Paracoccus sp. (in: a-proteobacteria)]
MIRDAQPDDAAAIGAIWNPVIRNTAITFWPTERSDNEIRTYMKERQEAGHGFFIWEDESGKVIAFSAYAQFRTGGGYAHSMEHTIYSLPEKQGMGIGSRLLAHLENHAYDHGDRCDYRIKCTFSPLSCPKRLY